MKSMDYDLNALSDTQLATCVDLYIQRAMRAAHEVEEGAEHEWCTLSISATCNRLDEEYEIKHEATCGWGVSHKYSGNNAIAGACASMKRYLFDKRMNTPTKVQPMLTAPVHDDIEDAQFTEVHSAPL